jgi:hypothetical protein
MTNPRRVYTRDQINHILQCNPAAVENAIVALFKLQTASERQAAQSSNHNDVGFNMCDARAGTRFARWLLGMNDRNQVLYPGKSLQPDKLGARDRRNIERLFSRYCDHGEAPIDRARRITIKHSRQLTDIANGLIEVPE